MNKWCNAQLCGSFHVQSIDLYMSPSSKSLSLSFSLSKLQLSWVGIVKGDHKVQEGAHTIAEQLKPRTVI